jgi:hypothetical protein
MATTKTQSHPGFFSNLRDKENKQAAPLGGPTCEAFLAAGRKYDVRNISSIELNMMSGELYQAEAISRAEFAMLSFQPEMSNNFETVGAQGVKRPDPSRHRDALAEWQEILRTQESFGSSDYFTERTRNVVAMLKRLAEIHDAQ